jgi:glutaminyl-tRNA synthetase
MESLEIFSQMYSGIHSEKKYTLRLKIDYQNSNATLRDPVIYRVKFDSHPRTKR